MPRDSHQQIDTPLETIDRFVRARREEQRVVRLMQVHCPLPRLEHRHAIVPESDAAEAALRERTGSRRGKHRK